MFNLYHKTQFTQGNLKNMNNWSEIQEDFQQEATAELSWEIRDTGTWGSSLHIFRRLGDKGASGAGHPNSNIFR